MLLSLLPLILMKAASPPMQSDGMHRQRLMIFVSPMGEFVRGSDDPATTWFSRADADKNARVSRQEFIADAECFFSVLDTDHDGKLTDQEMQAARPSALPAARRGAATGPGNRQPMTIRRGGAPDASRRIELADQNGDHIVEIVELRQAAGARFDALDVDRDGTLVAGEVRVARSSQ